ncbi:phage protein [Listeria ilorinensis]|uniref:phage protein n=1 Tax=Listeria ilorinensis TaxID=2867439 RepID=UPI003EBD6E36
MHEIYIKIDNGSETATYRHKNEWSGSLEIHFTVPFSDEPKPEECSIEIYNLSQNSINKIKKGASISIEAGYQGDIGLLSKGKIAAVRTAWSGVDKITSITFMEGIDYYDKKEVNITFGKGTRADTIIRRVASAAGIPISQISLPNNKSYSSGYTADSDAMTVIEEVVKDAGASIYFRRGNLIIRSIKQGDDERFTLNDNTGLIATPERIESDDYSGWSIQSLLQHRIATASIITLKSRAANGTFRVKNGSHQFDGSSFTTTCEVV